MTATLSLLCNNYCRKRFEQSKHGSRVKYRTPSRNLVVPDLLRNKVIGYYRTLSLFQFQSFFSTLFHEQYFLNLLKMIFLHCCISLSKQCCLHSVVFFICVCVFLWRYQCSCCDTFSLSVIVVSVLSAGLASSLVINCIFQFSFCKVQPHCTYIPIHTHVHGLEDIELLAIISEDTYQANNRYMHTGNYPTSRD